MKKLIVVIVLAILAMAISANAAVVVAWDHNAGNATGFSMYWWKSSDPANVEVMNIPSGAAREVNLLEGWFMPETEYTFQMESYNTVGKSVKSEVYKWNCTLEGYVPPASTTPVETPLPEPPTAPSGMTLESAVYKFIPVP